MLNILPFVTQFTSLISKDEYLSPTQIDVTDPNALSILTQEDLTLLNNQHFIIKDNVFRDLVDCEQIIKDCQPLFDSKSKTSKMGQGDEKWQNSQIRGDKIIWINDQTNIPSSLQNLFHSMKQIQTEFNNATNIYSHKIESHITCYPGNGTGYIRHLDATTKSHSSRKLTCLFYLNTEWKSGDGGELMIYDNKENKNIKIKPIAYRLLIFQSGCVEHQVLATKVPRFAFTLWLH